MLPSYQARSPFVLKHTTSLFVYMYGRMYVILYFDPRVFMLVMWSTPSQIALNWSIDQYPYHPRNWIVYRFEFFCGCS